MHHVRNFGCFGRFWGGKVTRSEQNEASLCPPSLTMVQAHSTTTAATTTTTTSTTSVQLFLCCSELYVCSLKQSCLCAGIPDIWVFLRRDHWQPKAMKPWSPDPSPKGLSGLGGGVEGELSRRDVASRLPRRGFGLRVEVARSSSRYLSLP